MPKSTTTYSMLVSCPSDVVGFLPLIEDAVASFNRTFGNQNNVSIEVLHWSKNTYSNMSSDSSPQEEINEQILNDSDFLVGIFWTRFGTPTKKYGSGTEEEINEMIKNNKPVILYFLDKPISPSKIDAEQLKKVQEFKQNSKNGLPHTIDDESQLSLKLRDDLELIFTRSFIKKGKNASKSKKENKTILWVDDRPENNVYVRNILEGMGLEIITALSTEQALMWIKHNDVAIIISDMGRKEGPREGYVLLDKLRSEGINIPFLIFAREGVCLNMSKKH